MATIVFASSKGGVGKSTTALALAQVLAQGGAKVMLLDADPNSPMRAWEELTGAPVNNLQLSTGIAEDNILEAIDEASEKSNFVIVDLEGSANMSVSYAIGRADLVLIPMQGSQLDANEAAKVVRLIQREEKAYRRKIPFAAVLTRTSFIKPRTAKHIRSLIEKAGIQILPVEMVERDAFKAIFTFGGTLYELTDEEVSSPEKAVVNTEAFAQAIIDHLREI
jgi:chromosome partitioning protein